MARATKDDLAKVVSRQLRRWRVQRALTQAELAETAGLATEAYGRLERGDSLPRVDTLLRLAQALGVTTDALLGRRETKAAQRAAEVTLLYGGDRARTSELRRLAHHLEGLSPATLRALRQIVVAFRRERGV